MFLEQRTIDETIDKSPSVILKYKIKALIKALMLRGFVQFIY